MGVPIVLAAAFDAGRFAGYESQAWINYLFVWLTVHQLGYYWAERDRELGRVASGLAFGGGLAALTGLTMAGPYQVALVGVPGQEFSNTTPPTVVLFALTLMQIGVISLLAPAVHRWLAGRKAWASVVLINGMIMSIYVWHITAAGIGIGAVSLLTTAFFEITPLGTVWWVTRPIWFAILIVPLLGLVAIFGRYESRTAQGIAQPRPLTLGIGIVISGAALASAAYFGTARVEQFPLRWWVPMMLIVGTLLAGMTTFRGQRN